MKRRMLYVIGILFIVTSCFVFFKANRAPAHVEPEQHIYHITPSQRKPKEKFTAGLGVQEGPTIRLLIVKHCQERMADDDANLAAQAAERAGQKGLPIQVIGNEHALSLKEFDEVVRRHVHKNESSGDTLIVHTIGHGHPDGSVQYLGQREGIFKTLAKVAEDSQQEMLWWQLSCHAAARLPGINTLGDAVQELFSAFASSPANEQSPTREQAGIMAKVFMAMAEKSAAIDPNGDGTITADELRGFLNTLDNRQRGRLLFARSGDEPIFGGAGGLANQIPIIDRNGPQGKYPRDYIPKPRSK